jgi:hypothetical protein
MKALKKYFAMLASAGFVMAVAATSHAAFSSKGTQTLSASAATGGIPTVAINAATIKNIVGNGQVGALSWTGAAPGGGFLVADQYIQLDSNINTVNGGIQIYTDNTNAAANPRYSVTPSSTTPTPAGLIMVGDTTQKLPTAWRASTYTLTSVNPIDPNAKSGESYLWFFHEDKAQVAVWTSSATSFGLTIGGQGSAGGGDPYVTVYAAPGTPLLAHQFDSVGNESVVTVNTTSSNSGVHFAQAPTSFGGFKSGNTSTYIYTEADFTGALAAQTYSTNRLILEAFSL